MINKTREEIFDFIKELGYDIYFVKVDLHNKIIEVKSEIKLSDLIKLRDFLDLKDIIIVGNVDSWTISYYLIKKGNIAITMTGKVVLSIEEFIDSIQFLSKNYTRKAIGSILEVIGDLIENKNFVDCGKILKYIQLEKLETSIILTFLVITLSVKNEIPERNEFFNKAKKFITEQHGIEKTDRLLGNLI